MDPKYIITRQGKDFVLYEGLLHEAHQQGLKRISTTLIQVPHPDNQNTAICHAEVETTKGVFSGIGDASPTNVNKNIALHLIRMSETRAKARALRDAINVGATSAEEMADPDADERPASEKQGESRPSSKATLISLNRNLIRDIARVGDIPQDDVERSLFTRTGKRLDVRIGHLRLEDLAEDILQTMQEEAEAALDKAKKKANA